MRRVRLASRRQDSLAAQVLGLFLVAVLVPLGVALMQLRGELRRAEDDATANARSVAVLAADSVGDTVAEATASAQTIAAMPSFRSGSDEDRDLVLAALADPRPAFNALVYYTDDFAQHGSSNPTGRGQRLGIASRAYAHEVVATGEAAFSAEPLLSPSDQQPVIPIAVPLRGLRDGGFLVARLQIARLPELWRTVTVPPGTTLAMIDTRSGRVLAGGRGIEPLPTRRASDRTMERIAAGERSFRTTSSEDGSARIVAWAPVARTPWVVAVGVPFESVVAPVQREAMIRAGVSVVVALASVAALAMLWRRIARRLDQLHRAAERWGRADWAHRTGADRADELGSLATSFDRMAALVEEAARHLAERDAERARNERGRAGLMHLAHALAEQADRRQIVELIEQCATETLGVDSAVVVLGPAEPAAVGQGAALTTPLVHEDSRLGWLTVVANGGRPFDAQDAELLELLARLGAARLVGHDRTRLDGVILAGRTAQHELNNRLARVVGYSELLTIDTGMTDEARLMAERVLAAAKETVETVERMSRVTRIEELDWGERIGGTIDLARSTEAPPPAEVA